jgi:hypothetical protein
LSADTSLSTFQVDLVLLAEQGATVHFGGDLDHGVSFRGIGVKEPGRYRYRAHTVNRDYRKDCAPRGFFTKAG